MPLCAGAGDDAPQARCPTPEPPALARGWTPLAAGEIEAALTAWRERDNGPRVYRVEPLGVADLVPGAEGKAGLRLFVVRSSVSSFMRYFDKVAVLDGEPRQALLVYGCEAYNRLLDALGAGTVRDEQQAIARVKAYLRAAAEDGASTMMQKIDEDDPEQKRQGGKNVRGWFASHPDWRFHPPEAASVKGGWIVYYYAWEMVHGVLLAERVRVDSRGHIGFHTSERLASGLGGFSIH
ncbi:MAG: hypothetical protein JXR96_10135 [Deltaproteobacteria bacterium]|nr:hypothetical protein [Deltaproteobacteria bacterium]